jgi:protein-S-isoprenylcysteine O-methyltransferase Ste14
VFIEVGLQTYDAEATHRLVTDGTYSLVRHPGVIWLFLTYVFAALYFTNYWLLVTAFVWTLVNTMYIVLQERLILRKLFHNYDTYIASTPMVIPSIRSMRRFMTLHNWRSK